MAKRNNKEEKDNKSPEQIALEEKEAKEREGEENKIKAEQEKEAEAKAKKEKKENDKNIAQMEHFQTLMEKSKTPEDHKKYEFWYNHYKSLIK